MGNKKDQYRTVEVQVPVEKKGGSLWPWIIAALVVGTVLAFLIDRMSDEQLDRTAWIIGGAVAEVILLTVVYMFGALVGRSSERAKAKARDEALRQQWGGDFGSQLPPPAWNAYNAYQQPALPPPAPPEYGRPLGQTRTTAPRRSDVVVSEPPGDWTDL